MTANDLNVIASRSPTDQSYMIARATSPVTPQPVVAPPSAAIGTSPDVPVYVHFDGGGASPLIPLAAALVGGAVALTGQLVAHRLARTRDREKEAREAAGRYETETLLAIERFVDALAGLIPQVGAIQARAVHIPQMRASREQIELAIDSLDELNASVLASPVQKVWLTTAVQLRDEPPVAQPLLNALNAVMRITAAISEATEPDKINTALFSNLVDACEAFGDAYAGAVHVQAMRRIHGNSAAPPASTGSATN